MGQRGIESGCHKNINNVRAASIGSATMENYKLQRR